ncbi:DUF2914 domain-containing protein [Winogradskyella bathintestinalis]|uniref:DUF2914 domain-containing protein n=1 Tax=Winogradskyella bathintestinalis TaxID=3035208 RepID=A0ABT7ZWU6_9FLAO|nr:DUF2914 domain-containing protein [Winogradskyella bathintestinalis]MDN3493208.1 DUF2914 domain-containing protein [Winogradskyella bathintestinalis]
MKRTLAKFRNSAFRKFIRRHEKYAPVIFFIGGFIFDTLTLGRVDRLYDMIVLCSHMTLLTITLYLYNLADDFKWRIGFLDRYKIYFPLAIQFFFGALSSAYVIYFSRSVSLSKTMSFFIILLALLFTNELLKKRISNKYLQFSVYFFISFTFFSFMIPVLIKQMNTRVFIISGLISLVLTLLLILIIYRKSPSTRAEVKIGKVIGIVILMYTVINIFYLFNLIPPVPLALQNGIVAHQVTVKNNKYVVSYEKEDWYLFWREHQLDFHAFPNQPIYVFTSIFAPTEIEKTIFHRWKWYNQKTEEWEIKDNIGYKVSGGRDRGYRGYTYKKNTKEGLWKVEVITEEELIIGVIDFEIIINNTSNSKDLVHKKF